MSATTTRRLPLWIVIYAIVFMVLVPIIFGLINFFNPELVDAGSRGYTGMAYGIRNIAIGLATIFALYYHSRSMMLLMFVQRLLIDVFNLYRSISTGKPLFALIMIPIIFWVPSIWGIRTLWSSKE